MTESCEAIRELICVAGGIINGCDTHSVQAVDEAGASEEPEVVMAQQDIDALFSDDEAAAEETSPVGDGLAAADPVAGSAAQPSDDAGAETAQPADTSEAESLMSQDDIDSLFD